MICHDQTAATGVWISAVALASVYFSVQITNKKEGLNPEDRPCLAGLRRSAAMLPRSR
jgi:hypothetical protein